MLNNVFFHAYFEDKYFTSSTNITPLNDYPIIMIDVIINSVINPLIIFSYHHLCPFKSLFINQPNFPTYFSNTPIINSAINPLIIFSYHHLCPFKSLFISQPNFPTCFSYTPRGGDLKKISTSRSFLGYANHLRPSGKVVSICSNIFYITDIILSLSFKKLVYFQYY